MSAVNSSTAAKMRALREANKLGCAGAHQTSDGIWHPCSSAETLARKIPNSNSIIDNPRNARSVRGDANIRRQWESLGSRGVVAIDTLSGGGLVSGVVGKSLNIAAPRDEDPDVFGDIEAARDRARQLGCIGVSRRISRSGRTIWMPCTNMSDLSNRTGRTHLGRRNMQKRTERYISDIVRRMEPRAIRQRKKSLYSDIHSPEASIEFKRLGPRVGQRIGRGLRSAPSGMVFIDVTGAIDADKDGIVFEGLPLERPIIPRFMLPESMARRVQSLMQGTAISNEESRRSGNLNAGEIDASAIASIVGQEPLPVSRRSGDGVLDKLRQTLLPQRNKPRVGYLSAATEQVTTLNESEISRTARRAARGDVRAFLSNLSTVADEYEDYGFYEIVDLAKQMVPASLDELEYALENSPFTKDNAKRILKRIANAEPNFGAALIAREMLIDELMKNKGMVNAIRKYGMPPIIVTDLEPDITGIGLLDIQGPPREWASIIGGYAPTGFIAFNSGIFPSGEGVVDNPGLVAIRKMDGPSDKSFKNEDIDAALRHELAHAWQFMAAKQGGSARDYLVSMYEELNDNLEKGRQTDVVGFTPSVYRSVTWGTKLERESAKRVSPYAETARIEWFAESFAAFTDDDPSRRASVDSVSIKNMADVLGMSVAEFMQFMGRTDKRSLSSRSQKLPNDSGVVRLLGDMSRQESEARTWLIANNEYIVDAPDSMLLRLPTNAIDSYMRMGLMSSRSYLNPDVSKASAKANEARMRNDIGQQILDRLFAQVTSEQTDEPTMWFIGGTTGSGKTTLKQSGVLTGVPRPDEAVDLDPDLIKSMHPDWDGGKNASSLHQWSRQTNDYGIRQAASRQVNMVVTGTGVRDGLPKLAKANGYKVVGHYVHVPREIAERRMASRAAAGGTNLPTHMAGQYQSELRRRIPQAIRDGVFDEFYLWDNSSEGGIPKLAAVRLADGKFQILDRKVFKEFFGDNGAAEVESYWIKQQQRSAEEFLSLNGPSRSSRSVTTISDRVIGGTRNRPMKRIPSRELQKGPFAQIQHGMIGDDSDLSMHQWNDAILQNVQLHSRTPARRVNFDMTEFRQVSINPRAIGDRSSFNHSRLMGVSFTPELGPDQWAERRDLPRGEVPELGPISMRGATLRGVDFSRVKVSEIDLTGAILEGVTFHDADLTRSNITIDMVRGSGIHWTDKTKFPPEVATALAQMRVINLPNGAKRLHHDEQKKTFGGSGFMAADNYALSQLRGRAHNFRTVNLSILKDVPKTRRDVDLRSANLTNVNLSQMRGTTLRQARGRGVSIFGKRALEIDIQSSDLQRMLVGNSDLINVTLSQSDLTGSSFQDSTIIGKLNLSNSLLDRVRFSGITFIDTDDEKSVIDISGSDLRGARLGNIPLSRLKYDNDTKFDEVSIDIPEREIPPNLYQRGLRGTRSARPTTSSHAAQLTQSAFDSILNINSMNTNERNDAIADIEALYRNLIDARMDLPERNYELSLARNDRESLLKKVNRFMLDGAPNDGALIDAARSNNKNSFIEIMNSHRESNPNFLKEMSVIQAWNSATEDVSRYDESIDIENFLARGVIEQGRIAKQLDTLQNILHGDIFASENLKPAARKLPSGAKEKTPVIEDIDLGNIGITPRSTRSALYKTFRRRPMTDEERERFQPIQLDEDKKIKIESGVKLVFTNEYDEITSTLIVGPQVVRLRGMPGQRVYIDTNPPDQDFIDRQMEEWERLHGPPSSPKRRTSSNQSGGGGKRTPERPRKPEDDDDLAGMSRIMEEDAQRRGLDTKSSRSSRMAEWTEVTAYKDYGTSGEDLAKVRGRSELEEIRTKLTAEKTSLEKTIQEWEDTGNWNGASNGVAMPRTHMPRSGVTTDISKDDLAQYGDTETLRQTFQTYLGQIDGQLNHVEGRLRDLDEIESGGPISSINYVTLRDLPNYDELVKRGREIMSARMDRLEQSDPRHFRLNSEDPDGKWLVHVGAPVLDGGVLDPDFTLGKGGDGTAGRAAMNTRQANDVMMHRVRQEYNAAVRARDAWTNALDTFERTGKWNGEQIAIEARVPAARLNDEYYKNFSREQMDERKLAQLLRDAQLMIDGANNDISRRQYIIDNTEGKNTYLSYGSVLDIQWGYVREDSSTSKAYLVRVPRSDVFTGEFAPQNEWQVFGRRTPIASFEFPSNGRIDTELSDAVMAFFEEIALRSINETRDGNNSPLSRSSRSVIARENVRGIGNLENVLNSDIDAMRKDALAFNSILEDGTLDSIKLHPEYGVEIDELLGKFTVVQFDDGIVAIVAPPHPIFGRLYAGRDWSSVELPSEETIARAVQKLLDTSREVSTEEEFAIARNEMEALNKFQKELLKLRKEALSALRIKNGSDIMLGLSPEDREKQLLNVLNVNDALRDKFTFDSFFKVYINSLLDPSAAQIADVFHDETHIGIGRGFDRHGEWANFIALIGFIRGDNPKIKLEPEERRAVLLYLLRNYGAPWLSRRNDEFFRLMLDNPDFDVEEVLDILDPPSVDKTPNTRLPGVPLRDADSQMIDNLAVSHASARSIIRRAELRNSQGIQKDATIVNTDRQKIYDEINLIAEAIKSGKLDKIEAHQRFRKSLGEILRDAQVQVHTDGYIGLVMQPHPVFADLIPGDRDWSRVELPNAERIFQFLKHLRDQARKSPQKDKPKSRTRRDLVGITGYFNEDSLSGAKKVQEFIVSKIKRSRLSGPFRKIRERWTTDGDEAIDEVTSILKDVAQTLLSKDERTLDKFLVNIAENKVDSAEIGSYLALYIKAAINANFDSLFRNVPDDGAGNTMIHELVGHLGTGRGFDRHGEWTNCLATMEFLISHQKEIGLTDSELHELLRLQLHLGVNQLSKQLNREGHARLVELERQIGTNSTASNIGDFTIREILRIANENPSFLVTAMSAIDPEFNPSRSSRSSRIRTSTSTDRNMSNRRSPLLSIDSLSLRRIANSESEGLQTRMSSSRSLSSLIDVNTGRPRIPVRPARIPIDWRDELDDITMDDDISLGAVNLKLPRFEVDDNGNIFIEGIEELDEFLSNHFSMYEKGITDDDIPENFMPGVPVEVRRQEFTKAVALIGARQRMESSMDNRGIARYRPQQMYGISFNYKESAPRNLSNTIFDDNRISSLRPNQAIVVQGIIDENNVGMTEIETAVVLNTGTSLVVVELSPEEAERLLAGTDAHYGRSDSPLGQYSSPKSSIDIFDIEQVKDLIKDPGAETGKLSQTSLDRALSTLASFDKAISGVKSELPRPRIIIKQDSITRQLNLPPGLVEKFGGMEQLRKSVQGIAFADSRNEVFVIFNAGSKYRGRAVDYLHEYGHIISGSLLSDGETERKLSLYDWPSIVQADSEVAKRILSDPSNWMLTGVGGTLGPPVGAQGALSGGSGPSRQFALQQYHHPQFGEKYITQYANDSDSLEEDLAESISLFFVDKEFGYILTEYDSSGRPVPGGRKWTFAELYPERHAYLTNLLYGSSGSQASQRISRSKRESISSRSTRQPTNKFDKRFKDSYGESTPDGDGDCFEASLNKMKELRGQPEFANAQIRLVHGIPLGTGGDAEGKRFPHAWVEVMDADTVQQIEALRAELDQVRQMVNEAQDAQQKSSLVRRMNSIMRNLYEREMFGTTVYDFTNGNNVIIPRVLYYSIGNIDVDDARYYSWDEVTSRLAQIQHFGPWE